jgi:hypothetical protein
VRAARLAFVAFRASAAWLGLGVVLADESPGPTLGAVAALVAMAGGWAGRSPSSPTLLRIIACLAPVLLARALAGTTAAVLATVCVAAGWWLRLRLSDAVVVLAVIGAAVLVTSSPSWRLQVVFLSAGAVTAGFGPLSAALHQKVLGRGALEIESRAGAQAAVGGRPHEPLSPTPMGDGRRFVPARSGEVKP